MTQKKHLKHARAMKKLKLRHQEESSEDEEQIIIEDDDESVLNDEFSDLHEPEEHTESRNITEALHWNPSAERRTEPIANRLGDGTSRSNQSYHFGTVRHRKELQPITAFFNDRTSTLPEQKNRSIRKWSRIQLRDTIQRFSKYTSTVFNHHQMENLDTSKNDHAKILSAICMLRKMYCKNKGKTEASLEVAAEVYGKGKSRAKAIKSWARDLITNGRLSESRKGKHRKTFSIIEDEDVKALCLEHLAGYKKTDERTPANFLLWINEHLLPSQGLTSIIKLRTAYNWLAILDYHAVDHVKGGNCEFHLSISMMVELNQKECTIHTG
jgi:hypothetical protein